MLFTFKDKGGFRKKVRLLRNLLKYLPGVLLLLAGCGEDEGVNKSSDAEFFPLRRGFYQVYSIRETTYELLEIKDDLTYQLKTEVVDSFPNQQGGYTYTIHRSKRNTSTESWEFQHVWSVRMNSANVVVSEENVPFIKIVFPAVENRKWNGNALNNQPVDEYVLTKKGKSYPLENLEINGEYIQITQDNATDNITYLKKNEEVYVRNIGLVHREITDLVYCSDEDECIIGAKEIESGTIYEQVLVAYGQN